MTGATSAVYSLLIGRSCTELLVKCAELVASLLQFLPRVNPQNGSLVTEAQI